ncbi:MAG: beta-N-acetylglucosaminidase domain-containing protein [Alicyclobacillus shizuokensis]|nr:beta-N-acetylglucosaminidase domain-containing protein [Alicyclobacillus shizuokensis]
MKRAMSKRIVAHRLIFCSLGVVGMAILFIGSAATQPWFHSASASQSAHHPTTSPPGKSHLPPISPTPQSVQQRLGSFPLTPTVALVKGKNTDPSALRTVTQVLREDGVKQIQKISAQSAQKQSSHAPLTIWIGGPSENAGSAAQLKSLNAEGPTGLPAGGYVLATGRNHGRAEIVLSGVDQTGTFYAAQTLRQLIPARGHSRVLVPVVVIRDWPSMQTRGVIEGFYGAPWSQQNRISQLNFFGENKMNTYVYSPKDDEYLRAKWYQPYPADKLQQIHKLVSVAKQNHVNFVYALSPGLSICYSSSSDLQKLMAKDQELYNLGVRTFALFFDDIRKTFHCQQDQHKFGNDPNPPAAAQAYLINQFYNKFIKTHPGTQLITVPTDYYQAGHTAYRDRFAQLVNPNILVYWTGVGVIAPTITDADAQKTYDIFQHKLLIWDNFPVNDYVPHQLLLGPLVGRDPGLSEHGVVGLTANPMIEAEASKIPLFTVADYAWNPHAYKPEKSWQLSLQRFGGSAYVPLRNFAENSLQSKLSPTSGDTVLKQQISAFWQAYDAGDSIQLQAAAAKLLNRFATLKHTPSELQAKLNNKEFLTEIKPWLDKLTMESEAGEAAVRMVTAQSEGNDQAAWRQRQIFDQYMQKANAIPQVIGSGVIPPFLLKAQSESDTWLQLRTPMTSIHGKHRTVR